MPKLFLDERNLRDAGLHPQNVNTLRALTEFLNLVTQVQETEAAIAAQQDAIDAVEEAVEDAELSLTSLDARVDDLEDFAAGGPYVKQDAGPAWVAPSGTASRAAFATFAAPDVSAAYAEAEVQGIADHVQILSQRIKALIDDLQANGGLSAA